MNKQKVAKELLKLAKELVSDERVFTAGREKKARTLVAAEEIEIPEEYRKFLRSVGLRAISAWRRFKTITVYTDTGDLDKSALQKLVGHKDFKELKQNLMTKNQFWVIFEGESPEQSGPDERFPRK